MIYCDNAATTCISKEVLAEMMPYLTENYGNASSLYSIGRDSRNAITIAREQVAKAINADPTEIYFTSCGSEADNWVMKYKGNKIISAFEHPAIYNSAKENGEVTMVEPNNDGIITPESVENALNENKDIVLVSVMVVNNEIGTIQPITEIGKICHNNGVLFHTDAVQAIGHIPIDVKAMGIDMLSMSGHKFHAPKGIGVLYIRKGIKIEPLIYGGEQEYGRRAGTENVASIVGIGKAIEIATNNLVKQKSVAEKRDKLLDMLIGIGGVKLNGSKDKRIANNINICVDGIESESLELMLDTKGICISAGSACCSGSLEPSRTLKAIGLRDEDAYNSVRLSICDDITDEDIHYIYESFKSIIDRLRRIK